MRILYAVHLFIVESLNVESFYFESFNVETFNVESVNFENKETQNHFTSKVIELVNVENNSAKFEYTVLYYICYCKSVQPASGKKVEARTHAVDTDGQVGIHYLG